MGKGKRPNEWYDAQVDTNNHWFSSNPLLYDAYMATHE